MPNTKNAIIRYQALDRCFRNKMKRYYIDDLVNECNKAIFDLNENALGVKKRQIYDDINFMKSMNGYDAPIEKGRDGRNVYYFYSDRNFSINKQPLTESEALELKETLITFNRFKGLPQFEWIDNITTRLEASFKFGEQAKEIIEFEQNEFLKGKDFINPLYHAIINKSVLNVIYESFKSNFEIEIEFHPYYLKQYNNRWFVFGRNPKYENITNLALDRIISFDVVNKAYIESNIDFKEYFEDIIGVTFDTELEPVEVLIKIDKTLWPYIKTKPLHGSQKTKKIEKEAVEITLELIPNYELETLLLQFGEKLTILEPKSLRESLKNRIQEMNKNYCADSLHK